MKRLSFLLAVWLLAVVPASAEERPAAALSRYTETTPYVEAEVSWERFDIPEADARSDELVAHIVASFRRVAGELAREMKAGGFDFRPCELNMNGKISGNRRTAGILWQIYEYTGGAHGNLTLKTQNYALPEGKSLAFKDLFRNPEKALEQVSLLARQNLKTRGLPADMVESGTEPEESNFKVFLLDNDGIILYFEPYQVAPWSEGVITMRIPLRKLEKAGPKLQYWN